MTVEHWPGMWLWPARDDAVGAMPFHEPRRREDPDRNGFVYYRGRFDVGSAPDRARLWLSADGRYLAFVNGQRLGRGPAPSDADVREVDCHEVAHRLVPGMNLVSVLVHSYGIDTAWYTRPTALVHSGRGGGALYAHVDLGDRAVLTTPGEWRCLRAPEWERDTPTVSASLGFVELRDARLEPQGWLDIAFDDSGWTEPEPCVPRAFPLPGRTYFREVRARTLPLLHERDAAPVALAVHELAVETPAISDIAASTRSAAAGLLEVCEVDGAQERWVDGRPVRVRTSRGRAVRLRFDFGELVAGRPRLEIDGVSGVVLDLTTAESLDADGRPAHDPWGLRQGHRFILRSGRQALERWDWVGFRYLFLTIHGADVPITLWSAAAVVSEDPSSWSGAFSCSDEVLDRIWRAGQRTVRLVTTDLIYGDVAREQRQWIGDVQAALGAILFAGGDRPVIRRALTQMAAAEPFADFLPMYAPGDYRAVGTTIPDFTLRWIIAVAEYHHWTADRSIVDELYPVILRSIRAFDRFVDEGGLIAYVPHWHFIDWAAVGRTGAAGPVNGLYLLALQAASRLAAIAGDPREAARLSRLGRRVRSAMRARLRARGDLLNDTPEGPISQHTNALAILGGVASTRAASRIAAAIADRTRLRTTVAGGVVPPEDADPDYRADRHVVAAQPGFMGFVLRAVAAAHREDLALDLIRHYWGPMAESGTCWETWSGRQSRCHPWAAAPTVELPRVILGAAPLEAGWRTVRIDPFISDLAWARGSIPTPHGAIAVEWSRHDRGIALELDVPDGMTAELRGGERLSPGRHTRRIGTVHP